MGNIDKIFNCSVPPIGGATYACTYYGNFKFIPFRSLISESGFRDNVAWRDVNYFNYTCLHNSLRTTLINEMETIIEFSFKKVKSKYYSDHKHGFYAYAKPNLCDPKTVIKYIGRYLDRPIIAASRIHHYDGDTVTFHYNRHIDDKYLEDTIL